MEQQLILTPTGEKPIWLIQVGDEVIGRDGVINVVTEVKKIDNTTPGWLPDESTCDTYLINNRYRLHQAQSVYLNGNVSHGYLIQPGDMMYNADGSEFTVTSAQKLDTNYTWYRFEITGDHSYIMDGILVHNASRFWRGADAGNWNVNGNWSATDGGGTGASFPVNGDAVSSTSTSSNGRITVNTASACTSYIQSGGYTGGLIMNASLTMAGTITIISGTTITGTSDIINNVTSTITTAGITISGGLQLKGASQTYTWADAPTITGTLTFGGTGTIVMSGAYTLTCGTFAINQSFTLSGNVSCSGTTTSTNTNTFNGSFNIDTKSLTNNSDILAGTGSPTISFSGGGTWSSNNSATSVAVPITNNGNLTLGTNVCMGNTTFTHASGTITAAGGGTTWSNKTGASTITINNTGFISGTCTLNVNQNYTFNGTAGFTLTAFSFTAGSSRTISLLQTNNYTVTGTTSNVVGTSGAILTITSSSASLQVVLNFTSGYPAYLATCTGTRINSNGGSKVYVATGILTTTNNWKVIDYTDFITSTQVDKGGLFPDVLNKKSLFIPE